MKVQAAADGYVERSVAGWIQRRLSPTGIELSVDELKQIVKVAWLKGYEAGQEHPDRGPHSSNSEFSV